MIIWNSLETADAESGMASPGIFTLNPVNDVESLERNADDGKGSRQWSGFVLSQKLFSEIEITSSMASSSTIESVISQDESSWQSSISEISDTSSLRHPGSIKDITSNAAIALFDIRFTLFRIADRL